MSNVTLTIGGREFQVASAPGEEERVAALGEMIDSKLTEAGAHSASSESRMLLVGALLVADELYDLRANPAPAAADGAASIDDAALEAIASRLENIAAHLESGSEPA